MIKPIVHELKERFGDNIFATKESTTLEEAVVEMLKKKDMTLSLAESCTGGAVAARIVNVSGASEVLKCGYVTYTNPAKKKMPWSEKKHFKYRRCSFCQMRKRNGKGRL